MKTEKIKLPRNTYIGKEQSNGLMVGGKPAYVSTAQLFLQCKYPNRKGCHDTIAILPTGAHGNEIIDGISDREAGRIFAEHGWLVKGYNNPKYTRCPFCAKKFKKIKLRCA